nr:hypothetical protein GCM10025730_06450 [Promicromonospora thailandica]
MPALVGIGAIIMIAGVFLGLLGGAGPVFTLVALVLGIPLLCTGLIIKAIRDRR